MATAFVNIDVPDLERAITFYTRALGLQLSRRLGTGFAELLGAQAPIYLLESQSGSHPYRDTSMRRAYTCWSSMPGQRRGRVSEGTTTRAHAECIRHAECSSAGRTQLGMPNARQSLGTGHCRAAISVLAAAARDG